MNHYPHPSVDVECESSQALEPALDVVFVVLDVLIVDFLVYFLVVLVVLIVDFRVVVAIVVEAIVAQVLAGTNATIGAQPHHLAFVVDGMLAHVTAHPGKVIVLDLHKVEQLGIVVKGRHDAREFIVVNGKRAQPALANFPHATRHRARKLIAVQVQETQ